MIFAVFDVLLAVNMCINYSFFTFISITCFSIAYARKNLLALLAASFYVPILKMSALSMLHRWFVEYTLNSNHILHPTKNWPLSLATRLVF